MKFGLFPVVGTMIKMNRSNTKLKQVWPWDLLPRVVGDLLVTANYIQIEESKENHFLKRERS